MEPEEFSNIRLTRREYRILKKTSECRVPKTDCERLLRLKFVEEDVEQIPGYMGKPLGTCHITDRGRDYLTYSASELWARYITPVIVTILTTILLRLLEWLLPHIQVWFSSPPA